MQRFEEHNNTPGVTAFVASLRHPLTPTLEAIRQTVLAADTAITEGIKWKSPSFYCHGWFLTIGCRKPAHLEIVFHCGAKVQASCTVREWVDDPVRLLSWPSKDRALLSLESETDFEAKKRSFQRIVVQWAAYQTGGKEIPPRLQPTSGLHPARLRLNVGRNYSTR